jgi:hypothetical protein
VRALLAGVAATTALLMAGVARPPAPSSASFTAAKTSPGSSVTADTVARYLSVYSQGSDPAGLTGYAVKQGSSPSVVAASGSDGGLSLDLGGWKNGGTMNRVFTLQAKSTLPWSSITVTTIVPPTPQQPVSAATIAAVGSTGGATSVTLTPGAKRQINFTIKKLPGNNMLYNAAVELTLTYPGYTGDFFTYSVPLKIWDGNGGGP